MTAFDASLRTRLVFGAGAIARLGELAQELGAARVFLITDPGVATAGHAGQAEASLTARGIEVRRFADVRENPTAADVDACRVALGDWHADLLVAVGGGSSIDVAKGCAFVRAGGGRMEDYWGKGKAKGSLLPLIVVPTTAGTGSEVQSFALIGHDETHQKMACGDPQAAPRIALLDPELTVTQPPFVTACTGLDAIGHAVETAVTKARNPLSVMYSTEAFKLAQESLPRVLRQPQDIEARGRMLLAAAYAGIAIENSMLGAAHSMANPLTAHHDIPHGQAVALALPHVVRFNAGDRYAAAGYAALARTAALCPADCTESAAVDALVEQLQSLLTTAGMERSLAAYGVTESASTTLAGEAAKQWTANFNPRPVAAADFAQLFVRATRPD